MTLCKVLEDRRSVQCRNGNENENENGDGDGDRDEKKTKKTVSFFFCVEEGMQTDGA